MGSGEVSLPGAVEQMQPQFISRFLEGQSGVTIKSVSCGDLFTICMTGQLDALFFSFIQISRSEITYSIRENNAFVFVNLFIMIKGKSDNQSFLSCHLFFFSDRGIIMTFGSGSNGCLGHGNFNDVAQVHVSLH